MEYHSPFLVICFLVAVDVCTQQQHHVNQRENDKLTNKIKLEKRKGNTENRKGRF